MHTRLAISNINGRFRPPPLSIDNKRLASKFLRYRITKAGLSYNMAQNERNVAGVVDVVRLWPHQHARPTGSGESRGAERVRCSGLRTQFPIEVLALSNFFPFFARIERLWRFGFRFLIGLFHTFLHMIRQFILLSGGAMSLAGAHQAPVGAARAFAIRRLSLSIA